MLIEHILRRFEREALMRTNNAVAFSLAAICLFAFLSPPSEEDEPGTTLTPYVSWSGAHSRIETKRYFRITSEAEWIDLWLDHVGMEKKGPYNRYYNPAGMPEIDFKSCMVVGVFQGKKWNSAGVIAVSIREEDERIRIRFDDKSYQTMGPDGGGERVTPFGLFLLPASSKGLVLEENIQGLKNQGPEWKERARFEKMR
jgi:hypothetical protein